MNRTVKALLLCLAAALLLTACHTDTDPWPVSDGAQPTVMATAAPTAAGAPQTAPIATQEPQQAQPTDLPPESVPETDRQPGGETDPGLNG